MNMRAIFRQLGIVGNTLTEAGSTEAKSTDAEMRKPAAPSRAPPLAVDPHPIAFVRYRQPFEP
jgi:hypothetical protein